MRTVFLNTILLRKQGNGKTNKIELFEAYDFGEGYQLKRFRLRVNGKWWPKGERKFVTKTQVKEMLFKHVTI